MLPALHEGWSFTTSGSTWSFASNYEIWKMDWSNASSAEDGTGQYPVSMTQKPRKGGLGS